MSLWELKLGGGDNNPFFQSHSANQLVLPEDTNLSVLIRNFILHICRYNSPPPHASASTLFIFFILLILIYSFVSPKVLIEIPF